MGLAANRSQFSIQFSNNQEPFRVISIEGHENLSDSYHLAYQLASENPNIDSSSLFKQAAVLTIQSGQHKRLVHGEVCFFGQVSIGRRFHIYQAQIVPKLWFLKHRYNSLVFQNLSVPNIIKQILESANITETHYEFRLTNQYPSLVYCIQHQESDYDFIIRLMAEAGIHFHFEHQPDHHKLIIGDALPAFPPIQQNSLTYKKISGMVPDDDTVYQLSSQRKINVTKVSLRDFNFERPTLDQQVESTTNNQPQLERYHYPGQYNLPEQGKQQAQRQLEADQASKINITGTSSSCRLLPGHRVTINGHPHAKLNQELIITKVNHNGRQPQAAEEEANSTQPSQYNNTFEAITSDTPYRQPSQQTKPHLKGLQTAVISGPGNEEIYTNEYGQVKVQFQWDQQGQQNENTSKWVRVSQNWVGPQWGNFNLPRIGQEVMLDFINGDPDQPIVIGRLYHASNRPPYKLPGHKTRSTLKSQSTPGGDGFNEIRLEDQKSQEQIFMHGEKDWQLTTKHIQREQVNANRHLVTGASRNETIKAEHHQKIESLNNQQVEKSETITIGQQYQLSTASTHLEKTANQQHLQAGMKIVIEAGNQATIRAGGSYIQVDSSGVYVSPSITLGEGVAPSSFSNPFSLPFQQAQKDTFIEATKSGKAFCEECAAKNDCEDCSL